MMLMLKDSRPMSMDDLRASLGSSQALAFSAQDRLQTYEWLERTLRRYLQKMTGLSAAQLTRLIAQFRHLNFHRPCGFATEVIDTRGKVRKRYEIYQTPFEKLKSLPKAERFLRLGVTPADLEKIAQAHSDTEYAQLLQRRKAELFRSFTKLGILG